MRSDSCLNLNAVMSEQKNNNDYEYHEPDQAVTTATIVAAPIAPIATAAAEQEQ